MAEFSHPTLVLGPSSGELESWGRLPDEEIVLTQ